MRTSLARPGGGHKLEYPSPPPIHGPLMKALVVLLGGLAGAIAGWVLAAAATMAFGGAFGLSDFEGERDMTAIFGVGPMGGIVGLVLGLWLAKRRTR
jgi:hypothetical protein